MKIKAWGNIPKKAHPFDAGFDLEAAQHRVIQPGGWTLVKTGTHVDIPPGFVGYVCSRSGLALKRGVSVLNAPGVVDTGYHGDVGVILHNVGNEPFTVQKGDRIAQLVIQAVSLAVLVESEPVDGTTRGANGFGSTGV